MRLIWSAEHLNPQQAEQFKKFCTLLQSKGIEFSVEETVDKNWGSDGYGAVNFKLWVYDEDQVEAAQNLLQEFQQGQQHPEEAPIAVISPAQTAKRFLEEKLHTTLKTEKLSEQEKKREPHFR